MEEMKSLIKVSLSVASAQTYCYFIVRKLTDPKTRLLSLLPIFCLFCILPFYFSTIHLRGISAFFLTWLSIFKLLLFIFNEGPLSTNQPISLIDFISLASLPIKIKQSPSLKTPTKSLIKTPLTIAIKGLLFSLVIHLYKYKQHYHHSFMLLLYCFHLYLALDLVLAFGAFMAQAMVGMELEPQFNKPFFATSLQDFWGKRWNLMVTSILRPTVYEPTKRISTRVVGRRGAPLAGVLASFAVSGLMHEVMFYYLTLARPTWEVTWFFVLHGFCVAAEIAVKRALTGRFRLHPAISGPLTLAFVSGTGFWLFFPQILRSGVDAKVLGELDAVGGFLEEKMQGLMAWGFNN